MSVWLQALVAALLLTSAVLTLVAAFGLVRMPHVFARLHAHALVCSLAGWCVAAAAFAVFIVHAPGRALTGWVIMVMLTVAAPISVVILSQASWRRSRHGKQAEASGATQVERV